MRYILTVLASLVVAGAAVVDLGAHHGYKTFFDPKERTTAIEGTLEQLLYANPHVVMPLEQKWYGVTEFAITDPDGWVITLAERA